MELICKNPNQRERKTCNDVDYDDCKDCPCLCSWDWVGGWYTRCNNKTPIKTGDLLQPLEKEVPCHRRKDK
jgi:hypothetical protein